MNKLYIIYFLNAKEQDRKRKGGKGRGRGGIEAFLG